MNRNLFRTPATDILIGQIVSQTQDEAKWATEAEVLISFSICHFLCRRLFEIHGRHDLYIQACSRAKKEAGKLADKYEIEKNTPQFLSDFWIVYDTIYSDSTKIPALIEREFDFRTPAYERLPVSNDKRLDLLRKITGIEELLLASLTLEEIQTKLAHRAFDELLRQKTAENCPELSRLFAFGNIASVSNYKGIIRFLLRVTDRYIYQVNEDSYNLPQDSLTEKESFLNEVITKELAKMMGKNGFYRLEKVLHNRPLHNLMQKLRTENKRLSKLRKNLEKLRAENPHAFLSAVDQASYDYAVDNDEVAADQTPFDLAEYLPAIAEAFGPAKASVIAGIWELDDADRKMTNVELGEYLGKHPNTVGKHKRELRENPENLQKFQEIILTNKRNKT